MVQSYFWGNALHYFVRLHCNKIYEESKTHFCCDCCNLNKAISRFTTITVSKIEYPCIVKLNDKFNAAFPYSPQYSPIFLLEDKSRTQSGRAIISESSSYHYGILGEHITIHAYFISDVIGVIISLYNFFTGIKIG